MVDPEYTISSPTGGLKVKPHSKQETDDGLRASQETLAANASTIRVNNGTQNSGKATPSDIVENGSNIDRGNTRSMSR